MSDDQNEIRKYNLQDLLKLLAEADQLISDLCVELVNERDRSDPNVRRGRQWQRQLKELTQWT